MLHQEKIAFIKTLLFIAMNDNELSEEEEKYFQELGASLDITSEELFEIKDEIFFHLCSIDSILDEIHTDEVKETLIRELLSLCFLDNNYSDEERQGIITICEFLNFDINYFEELEHFYEVENKKNIFNKFVKKTIETSKITLRTLGKRIQNDSQVVSQSVSKGVKLLNQKISSSIEIARKTKEENEELREKLKNNTLTEAIKQKVIIQLNNKILNLTAQLKAEKERNDKNEEMIELLQLQIQELIETKEVAESIKTA